MQNMRPMKTAIVGCGTISEIFFQNFTSRFSIIEPVMCCSRNEASARAKAEQYGLRAVSFEEILEDPEIELVVNLTPASEHYDIIRAALLAGKHVFTEKVIAPSFEKAQELQRLALERGLYLCSEPDHFLGSSWQCARQYVDAGILGDVTGISACVSQNTAAIAERLKFVNEPAGGIGYDFGIYLVTQMVALLGPAVQVSGLVRTHKAHRVHRDIRHPDFGQTYAAANEDLVSASILFGSGAAASIHMNGCSIMEAPHQFMIYGETGALSMPLPAVFSGDMKLFSAGSFEPSAVHPVHGLDHDARGAGAAEMAWAIRLGRVPRAEASLGVHCLEILQGIEESSRTGKAYRMTTACSRPAPLPAGYRGLPGFSFSEEGSLAL